MTEIDQVKRQMMYDDDFIEQLDTYIKRLTKEEQHMELYDFWWRWMEEHMTRDEVSQFVKTGEL